MATRLWQARLAFVVALGLASATGGCRGRSTRTIYLDETTFRQMAKHQVVPQYPDASFKRNASGVAVAAVVVDVGGQVERLELLEAPDANIGRAVQDAVSQWSFALPATNDRLPARVSGKLTFYFEIQGTQGRVLSATEKAGTSEREASSSEWEIREADLERLRRSARVIMLDIQEEGAFRRSHRDGAVNIPLESLVSRAKQELPVSAVIAIDCHPNDQVPRCRRAYWQLAQLGFGHPILLTTPADGFNVPIKSP